VLSNWSWRPKAKDLETLQKKVALAIGNELNTMIYFNSFNTVI
jgi:hypothetical protein